MKCALLFVLLLLLSFLPCVETQSRVPAPTEDSLLLLNQANGSTCAQWLCGTEPPRVKAFQCARKPDGAEVKYCCGICGQMRNCSFEEVSEGSPARPTDGGPEPCHPSTPVTQWEKLTLFCGGVVASIIFYVVAYSPCRRYWRKKRSTGKTQEGIELEVSSSERSRDSAEGSNTLTPPSSAAGLQSPHGGPTAASSSAPGAQPRAGDSENVTIMWYPTGFVPLRIGPNSSSQPIRSGKRPLTRSGK